MSFSYSEELRTQYSGMNIPVTQARSKSDDYGYQVTRSRMVVFRIFDPSYQIGAKWRNRVLAVSRPITGRRSTQNARDSFEPVTNVE